VLNNSELSRVVSARDLAAWLQKPVKTIYRLVKEPSFPPPLPLGRYRLRWLRSAVEAWLQEHGNTNTTADPLQGILARAIAMCVEGPVKTALERLLANTDLPDTTTPPAAPPATSSATPSK